MDGTGNTAGRTLAAVASDALEAGRVDGVRSGAAAAAAVPLAVEAGSSVVLEAGVASEVGGTLVGDSLRTTEPPSGAGAAQFSTDGCSGCCASVGGARGVAAEGIASAKGSFIGDNVADIAGPRKKRKIIPEMDTVLNPTVL